MFSFIICGTTPLLSHYIEVILLLCLIQQSGLQSGWSDWSYQTSHQFNRSSVLVCSQFSSARDFYEYFSFAAIGYYFNETSTSQMSSRQWELAGLNGGLCTCESAATALTCVPRLIHETRLLLLSKISVLYSFSLLATDEEEITSTCRCL